MVAPMVRTPEGCFLALAARTATAALQSTSPAGPSAAERSHRGSLAGGFLLVGSAELHGPGPERTQPCHGRRRPAEAALGLGAPSCARRARASGPLSGPQVSPWDV